MKELNLKHKISRNEEATYTQIDDEIVIMGIEDRQYYGLNALGSTIWNLLEKPMTVQAILDHLLHHYDVDSQTCLTDTLQFLESMQTQQKFIIAS